MQVLVLCRFKSDGKLVAAGWSANGFTLIRYNSSGIPDNTFGSGGIVTTQKSEITVVLSMLYRFNPMEN